MPTFAQAKSEILRIVGETQGITGSDLGSRMSREFYMFDIPGLINILLFSGAMSGLQYTVHGTEFVKTFLLPKHTTMTVCDGNET